MSYDLFFEAGPGRTLDKKSFAAHFKGRRNYEVGNGQAVYQNENTGVYFIFDEPSDEMVAFNLNFYRPHVFALEAAAELEALADAFRATVTDPQEGIGADGKFSREGFVRAWNEGNRFAYRSMVKEMDAVHTWPAKRIREVWEWNFARPSDEEMDSASVFVPSIFAVNMNGELRSVAVWPPQCPVLLPAVDAVLVPLAQTGKASEEMALVPWDEVLPAVRQYQEKAAGIARYRLEFEDWPSDVAEFLNRKRKPMKKLEGVGLDEVLDRELVDAARKE